MFAQPGAPPSNAEQIIEELRLYYTKGLRDLLVQMDMVLTFHFRQGNPEKYLYECHHNPPTGWRAKRANLQDDFPGLCKDISW